MPIHAQHGKTRDIKPPPFRVAYIFSFPRGKIHVPCTLSPASTWILAPVILVFFANMMYASAQSWRSVSCLSAAVSFAHWILSSEYFLPYGHALAHSRTYQMREAYPFREQQPGQYGVHAYLRALRRAETFDELQLRRLGHCVGHRGA